nr:hypothetical protein CFP56_09204 [Quercus suber]
MLEPRRFSFHVTPLRAQHRPPDTVMEPILRKLGMKNMVEQLDPVRGRESLALEQQDDDSTLRVRPSVLRRVLCRHRDSSLPSLREGNGGIQVLEATCERHLNLVLQHLPGAGQFPHHCCYSILDIPLSSLFCGGFGIWRVLYRTTGAACCLIFVRVFCLVRLTQKFARCSFQELCCRSGRSLWVDKHRRRPILWQRALQCLRPKDRAVLPLNAAIKPDELIIEIEKYQSQSKRKSIRLPNGETLFVRDVLEKVSRWLKKFVQVGDAIAQYDPGHAALPWAAVSLSNLEKHAAVLEGIEKISFYIVWSRIEESNLAFPYDAHAQLEGHFVELYTVMLAFMARCIRFLRNKPR